MSVFDVLSRSAMPVCLVLAMSVTARPARASSAQAGELDVVKARKVKAAYLYNFTKFVDWPEDAFETEKAPFVIAVLGDNPFARILDDTVKDKKTAARAVKVRCFDWAKANDRAALLRSHMLYVGVSERYRLDHILASLNDHPVLVVGDIPEFARNGGMIGFVLERGRIVFEINHKALERARLKASSKLLKLARIVELRRRHAAEPRIGMRWP